MSWRVLQRHGQGLSLALLLGAGLTLLPQPCLGGSGFQGTVRSGRFRIQGIRGVEMTFVGLTHAGAPVWKLTTTDDRGHYAIDLPLGKYVVRAEHPRYEDYYSEKEPWVVSRPFPQTRDVTLELRLVTTVFVVRHAEKSAAGGDPPLRPEGLERAQRLANALAKARISAVYTTPTTRTRQTAQPTADAFGLTLIEYTDIQQVAQDILRDQRGRRVLVVGHADTIQPTVQALGASANDCVVTGDEYDNLCTVVVSSEGDARGVNLQYGSPSP